MGEHRAVTPVKTGVQNSLEERKDSWIPAYAGMTSVNGGLKLRLWVTARAWPNEFCALRQIRNFGPFGRLAKERD